MLRRAPGLALALSLLAVLVLAPRVGGAQPASDALVRAALAGGVAASRAPAPFEHLGEIERRLAETLVERLDRSPLRSPGGRVVDQILIETVDVFTDEDFLPTWLNVLHVTTRPHIVEQRLTIAPGDRADDAALAEVRRHLLDDLLFSTVIVVPLRDDQGDPDKIDLLVITRDVWSLRLNSNFQTTGDAINFVAFSIAETNFLGLNKHLALSFLIEQDTVAFGPTWVDPAVFGSRLTLDTRTKFAINHDNGDFEGASGTFELAQPLYSLQSTWGWSVAVDFRHLIERAFVGSDLRRYPINADPDQATVPWTWRNRIADARASVTHSAVNDPERTQHHISLGWRVLISQPETLAPSSAPRELVDDFRRNAIPRTRQDSYPFVRYRTFEPDFRTYRNFETLALLEELRLGHELVASVGIGAPFSGSSEALVAPSLSASWATTALSDDDYAIVAAGVGTRLERGRFIDTSVEASLRYTSPLLFDFMRLSVGALIDFSFADSDNSYATLGGDNALRGFPSAYFIGDHLVRANVELRTVGLELLSMWWGLAAFYDGGDAFDADDLSDVRWHHGAGLGLRWLLPQFNRAVIRIDWGFPLDAPALLPGGASIAFGQAF